MTLAERLKAARLKAGLSQAEVAARAGISQPTYQGLESGEYKKTAHLSGIAQALGVRPEELTGDRPIADILTLVPKDGVALRGVPVIGAIKQGPKGAWVEDERSVGHEPECIMWPTNDRSAYAMRVEGDSMSPRIRHGERVMIEPDTEVLPGDDVAVRTADGQAMIRVFLYERDGRVYLECINQREPVISFAKSEIETFHFVAGIARRTLTR